MERKYKLKKDKYKENIYTEQGPTKTKYIWAIKINEKGTHKKDRLIKRYI